MKLNLRYLIKLKLTIIFLVVGSTVFGQLTGTKYIPVDYATIASAVTALNSSGVGAGGVTFNIAANYTETISSTISITVTGTSGNPVVFQKDPSTSGSNPLITAYTGGVGTPATAIQDGIIRFVGSDYITIDGIDVKDNPANTTNPSTMEYGYALYKASTSNGCQNITIKNCAITLNNINNTTAIVPMVDGSTGIIVMNSLATTATTVMTPIAGGTNSNNKFYTNTIQNCNNGIALMGFAAVSPFTLADAGNDVGGSSAGTGNTIINYGGASGALNAATGIRTLAQYGINISYNTINNNNGAGTNHPNTLRGILTSTAVSASATITYNTVTLSGGGTTQNISCIENASGSTAAGNTINISNNTITNCTYSTATTGGFYGILNSATPATLTISSNTISNNSSAATAGGFLYGINNTGAATAVTISSNTFSGNATAALTTGLFVGIWNAAASANVTINTNTLAGNSTTSLSGAYYAIYNTGIVTAALTISSNNIGNGTTGAFTFNAANSGSQIFINSTLVAATAALSISNNNFQGITYAVQGTGPNTYISNTAATLSQAINNNTFTSLNVNTTGSITFIANSVAVSGTGTQNVNSNSIVTSFTKAGIGGTVTLFTSAATSVGGSIINNNSNNFSNITVSGTTIIAGWTNTDAGSFTKKIQNNTFSNWTGGSGSITGMAINLTGTNNATSGNTISNISSAGPIFGITTAAGKDSIYSNTINTLASTGAFAVTGISITAGTSKFIFRNKIYDLSNSNAGGTVNGILVSGTTIVAINIYNNLIGDLRTPVASVADPIRAISVTATAVNSSINVYYNTIYLNATSTGILFGTTGIYHTINATATTAALTLRNNIIENTSTPNGAGFTVAFRRSAATLTNYAAASNNNIFYAGPAGTTRLIFYDGANSDQSLASYKTRVATRDAQSFTEDLITGAKFLSTTGSSSNYLHLDPAKATLAESGGVNISGFTDDFDGQTRQGNTGYSGSGTAPDIGADEFAGTTPTALSGSYNVGAGQTYTSLTSTGGLFAAINSLGLSANVTVNVTSDLTEDGSNALFQWVESGVGNYTLTIQPNSSSARLISGDVVGGLIRFNGADRVTINGSNGTTNKYFAFRNTNTAGATGTAFTFINGATANTIRYCSIESYANATNGVILFSTSTVNGGNSSNTIQDCNINATVSSNTGNICIYSAGTAGNENSSNSISNNNIYNYRDRALDITATGSTGWTISGNSFYNGDVTVSIDYASASTLHGIRILGGTGYLISNNFLGGNAASAGGTSASYASTLGNVSFQGIVLTTSGSSPASNVKGNTIANITLSSVPTVAGSIAFAGIETSGSGINIGGASTGDGNIIGSNTVNSSISVTTTTGTATFTTTIRGISCSSAGGLVIGNQIAGIDIKNIGTAPAPSTFIGINISNATAPSQVNSNIIGSTGAGAVSNSIRVLSASTAVKTAITGITIAATVTSDVEVDGNTIQNLSHLSAVTTLTAGGLIGISNASTGTSAKTITNNTITSLYFSTYTTALFYGIYTSGACSSISINSNTIHGNASLSGAGAYFAIYNSGAATSAINISSNNIGDSTTGAFTFAAANSGTQIFINNTAGANTAALSISNNNFQGITYSVTGSGPNTYISNTAATLSQDISNNTFTNLDVNTTGNIIFISNSVVIPANGSQTVSGNSIVTGFNKGGAAGTITLFTSTSLSPAGGITVNHSNNNFSNITLTGATTIAGWVHTEASGSLFAAKTFTGNIFNNWITGASAVTGLSVSGLGENSSVTNNTLTNLNGQAAITAILIGATGSASALNLTNNTINNLTSSGTGGIVTGLSSTNASTIVNINSNSINNLSSTVVGSTSNVRLTGITVTANTTVNINNNIIHTLVVSGTTTPVFNAITVVSTGTVTIQNNSIHSISTGGTNTLGYTFNGIATSGAAGNFTISNNTIGTPVANSMSVGTNGVTTTGVCTFNGITNAATGTISITNNTVQNASVFGTGASVYTGIANTGAASSVSIASNAITSGTNSGAGAALIRGILISNGTTINVNQNIISSLTGNSITTGSINGLLISGGTTANAYQNTISSLMGNAITTLATGSINGLSITGGTDIYAYRNKIYDLESSSAALTGSVNGIIVSGATSSLNVTIRNNIIGDLKVTAGSGANLIRGISVIATGTTSNVNVYYNTIYLSASSSGANFGTSCIFHTASATATTAALDLRNNIIINTSTPNGTGLTVAYRRSTGAANTLNNYSSTSNNNLFFAGVPGVTNLIYSDGTSSAQTLEAYQGGIFTAGTIAGRDSLSFTEDMITNLKFLSVTGTDANYLNINPAKPTLAESGAVNIAAVTLDFDGDIRQGNSGYIGTGSAPDIGADEFEGICINSLWTGAISTDWNNVANWRGYLPYSEINVIIPTGLSKYPVLSSGPAGILNNITIQNGASLSVIDNVLQISGSITNYSTFIASNGTIELNGSSAQTIPVATFSGNALKSLTINNTAGVTLGGALSLTDALTIENGSLTTGGYLTLKSTATTTARVAQITSGASTPISGNVIVERYVPGRRKYRLITSAVTTHANTTLTPGQEAYSIWGNWQNQGNNITANIGTIITGGSSADGFDQQTTNASLFTYDDVNRRYTGYTTANGKNTKYTPLKAGVAYYMFVYGDRTNTITTSSPKNTIISSTGTLLTGDQAYNTSSAIPLSGVTGRFTLLGNPFASPIDWATIPKTDLANTYWGWDPNLGGTGGYITVTTTGTVTLQAPYSGSTGLNQYIQPGQGFFVKTSGPSPVLTIREQDKVADFNGNAFRIGRMTNDISLLAINLQYVNGSNKILADGVLAAFDAAFSNQAGAEDAAKMANSSAESIAILNDTTSLSIDARQMPQSNDTLFLNVSRVTKPQYTLQIFAQQMESSGIQAYLQDRYLNTLQPLSLSDTNNIVINVSAGIPASADVNRFRIVFHSSVIAPSVTYTSIKATPKNTDIQIDWEVAKESGIQKYEIERSADSINFNKTGEVTARGNNSSESYHWLDVHPITGNNYYRVRAIQAGGKFFVSKMVIATMNADKPAIKIFPNPVKNKQLNIRSDKMEKGKYTLLLYNPQGQQMIYRVIDHPGGSFNQIIYVSKMLPAGMYYLKIANEKEEYDQTIFLE